MGSAAIRTKLALRMANASACSAHALSTLAIRAATVSTRPLIASAARRGGGHLGHGRDEDLQLVAQPVDVRGQVGLRVRAGRHAFLAHSRTAGASTR